MIKTRFAALIGALCLGTQAVAGGVALSLPLDADASVSSTSYSCEQAPDLSVRYINSGPNALAVIAQDGQDVVFVNVVAASGARYVSGLQEWWTKGDTARLSQVGSDQDAVTCTAR